MSLANAYFEILEPGYKHKCLEVQFNPTELSYSKTAQFAEIAIPGLDSPVQQFIRGGTETLSVELFFDTTDQGMGENAISVTDKIDKFYQLVKQNPETHAPPRCRFSWGEEKKEPEPSLGKEEETCKTSDKDKAISNAPFWFSGVVESVERKFTLFSPQGVPLRAKLNIKIREYKTVEQMVAKLGSADHTKTRVLKRRQRLEQLSTDEYETPTEWRRIAEENDIDDPRRIPPGKILRLPPIRVELVT